MTIEAILEEFGKLCALTSEQAQQYASLAEAAAGAIRSRLRPGADCGENSGRLALAAAYWMRERYESSGSQSSVRLGELSVSKERTGASPDEWRLLIEELLLPEGAEFFCV